ncbi:lysophosphatidylserine lipase ABHD12-like isoform X4 [Falco naumanni]|uniref:lysophosphatidylserine lipase ABHD12-like isoform X4 n=1 Tax=Falco naumanni TaxID=148594 RepID=UPI001ADE7451|nr:lysophosphatidylserine lipase ABHD12-like isoform X4 [Falco naumanni]
MSPCHPAPAVIPHYGHAPPPPPHLVMPQCGYVPMSPCCPHEAKWWPVAMPAVRDAARWTRPHGSRPVSAHLQQIYRQFPGCEYFILDLLALRNMFFCSDENVKVLTCPLLILHAEDDAVLPLHLGHKLFETAHSTYKDKTKVKFITFPKKLGLGHNYISFSLELPTLVKNFLDI